MGNFGGIQPVDPFSSYIGWVRRVEERVNGQSFSLGYGAGNNFQMGLTCF